MGLGGVKCHWTGYFLRLLRIIRIIFGESFGVDFEIPAGGFCFQGRLPLRPRLRRVVPGRVVPAFGPLISVVAASARGSNSVSREGSPRPGSPSMTLASECMVTRVRKTCLLMSLCCWLLSCITATRRSLINSGSPIMISSPAAPVASALAIVSGAVFVAAPREGGVAVWLRTHDHLGGDITAGTRLIVDDKR